MFTRFKTGVNACGTVLQTETVGAPLAHAGASSAGISMKIVDLKCALIGKNPIVRIVTDEGISGYGEAENYKPYLKPFVLQFRDALIGEDPTDVERCMLKIRQRGAFKPYGAAVSIIEHALWDIAGKAAGVPVYKLLGGKVRDQVQSLQRLAARADGRHHARTLRRRLQAHDGASRRLRHHQAGHRLPFADAPRVRGLLLRQAQSGQPIPWRHGFGPDHRARHGPHDRLRRRHEGRARRQGRRWRSIAAPAGWCRTPSASPGPSRNTICSGSRTC